MRLTISPKFLCMCLILLVHFAELANSQLDFGDSPRITTTPSTNGSSEAPPQSGNGSGGGGSSSSGGVRPSRGGGGRAGLPSRGVPPARGAASSSPPRSSARSTAGSGGSAAGGGGPPIIEAGGASENGLGGDLIKKGKGGGRGLFVGLGGRRGKAQPPPESNPQLIPQSVCSMKADPGFCNLMIGRWYYDRRYHRCLPFLYTGCGGNINNFISIRQCEQASYECHAIPYSPAPILHNGLTPGALNPINPLAHLAPGFILGG